MRNLSPHSESDPPGCGNGGERRCAMSPRKAGSGMERRDFLKFSVAASGGLLIGFHLAGIGSLASGEPSSADAFMPNAFVRIGSDDRVTVIVNHSEMGQGVYT